MSNYDAAYYAVLCTAGLWFVFDSYRTIRRIIAKRKADAAVKAAIEAHRRIQP